jgi:hypothetical protein
MTIVFDWNFIHKHEILQTRHISILPELKDLFAYKIEYYMNDKLISDKQGLANYEDLQVYVATGKWENELKVHLVEVAALRDNFNKPNDRMYVRDLAITNVYDCGVVIDEKKKHTIIGYNNDYFKLNSLTGDYFTTGIHFDYSCYFIDDHYYDLEKLLKKLKKRKDIIFVNGPVITDIPSYEMDGNTKTVDFWWMPNEEDYNKAFGKDSNLQIYNIPKEIFGVDPKEQII